MAGAFALVCGLTWLATGGVALLPPIIEGGTRISAFVVYPIGFTILLSAAALVLLWIRPRSVLDQWLMVVVVVSIAELAFSGLLPSVRFSLGFYAGRVLSLITASIVLIVLLAETTRLYVRLARSNALLQRERSNKLMNLEAMAASIAHEVRQPLTGISASGGAALIYLGKTPPDLEGVESSVQSMVEATRAASGVFDNLRALFGRAELVKDQVDVNALVIEVLRMLDADFRSRRIVDPCGAGARAAARPGPPGSAAGGPGQSRPQRDRGHGHGRRPPDPQARDDAQWRRDDCGDGRGYRARTVAGAGKRTFSTPSSPPNRTAWAWDWPSAG